MKVGMDYQVHLNNVRIIEEAKKALDQIEKVIKTEVVSEDYQSMLINHVQHFIEDVYKGAAKRTLEL